MKPILLKTLAATSLVATSQADVHVLGATFKERGVNAPQGTIITNPGTVAATRGYLIMDSSVLTATPQAATYIEYGENRSGGVVQRYYTIDTDFRAFRADGILGGSGGRRLYGHMRAPVKVAEVANPLIPFSGTTLGSDLPKKLSFDQTTFQTGSSDSVTGPQIVRADASTLRSVVSGSANTVKTKSTSISEATEEFVARLVKQGYERILGEAPTIVTDLPATLPLQDGAPSTLSVVLSPDVYPVEGEFAEPTFAWFKNNVQIPGAVGSSYVVTGGASTATNGSGSYRVVATNEKGSATSTTTVVSSVGNAFTTNLPASVTINGAETSVLSVVLNPLPVTPPAYQWFKNNVAIAAADGGTGATLSVTGGAAATGAGTYRVEVTNSAGMVPSGNSIVTVNNVPMSFTTNLPTSVAAPFAGTVTLAPVVIPNALPKVTTYQWMKAPTGSPSAFVNVADADGGKQTTLNVTGAAGNLGPGFYRLTIGNGTTTLNSAVANVTTAPAP